MTVTGTPRAPRRALWAIVGGLVFTLVALVAAPLARIQFSSVLDNDAGNATWLTYAGGVFLTATVLWWLLIIRPQRITPMRGAVTGVLVALFSYPVVLLLAEIFQRDWEALINVATLAGRLLNLLLISGLTFLTTGLAATLTMAVTGALIGWMTPRFDPSLAVASEARKGGGLLRRIFRILGGLAVTIVVLLLGGFIWLSVLPFRTDGITNAPVTPPAKTYEAALAAFASVEAAEAELPLNPRCHSQMLSHGQKTARVVIYFHGLTTCPAQADTLAPQLFALGYNVYVPRLPGHGEADPLTLALASLKAEELVATADSAIALAHGLGDDVVVSGLSAGGTLAAWVAQNRGDVANTVVISPFLAPYSVPPWANHAATNLLLMLPNIMMWWDASHPESSPEMSYAYPRFATRALAEVMRLGGIVQAEANRTAPAAGDIGMLLNAGDTTISEALNYDLLTAWTARRPDVALQVLPVDLGVGHDIIDPNQADANIAGVYPVLIDMIAGPDGP